MDERHQDAVNKLREMKALLLGGSPEELFEAAGRMLLAFEFRQADPMMGLESIPEDVMEAMWDAALDALFAAGARGHEAATLEALERAYFGRDQKRAEACFLLAQAHQEKSRVAYMLGLFYCMGWGCQTDHAASLRLHRQAAAAGEADAMFELYALQCNSDPTGAHDWLVKAAENGNARAMSNLGGLYATGNGVPRDQALSLLWYDRAARAGHGKAAATLGVMYGTGQDAPKDLDRARQYFKLSEEAGFDWQPMAAHFGVEI